jgi:hypothetical protein
MMFYFLFDLTKILWVWIDFEALVFELVMLHQLIRTTIVGVPLVKNILANFVKGLCDVQIQSKQFLHDCCIYLSILIVHLLLCYKMEVVWQILNIPDMFLDLL